MTPLSSISQNYISNYLNQVLEVACGNNDYGMAHVPCIMEVMQLAVFGTWFLNVRYGARLTQSACILVTAISPDTGSSLVEGLRYPTSTLNKSFN